MIKDRQGETAGPYEEQVSAERIAAFARAVGAPEGSEVEGAPPTFMTVFRKGEFELFQRLGIPLSKVLHAEQSYAYGAPIRAGDRVRFQTQLASVLEKQGSSGAMYFLVFQTEAEAVRGASAVSVGSANTTIVVRGVAL